MNILLQVFWNLLWAAFLTSFFLFAILAGLTIIFNTLKPTAPNLSQPPSEPDLSFIEQSLDTFLVRYNKSFTLSTFSLAITCLATFFTQVLRYISQYFNIPSILPHKDLCSTLGDMSNLLDEKFRKNLLRRNSFWDILTKRAPEITHTLTGITKNGNMLRTYFITPLLRQFTPRLDPQEVSHVIGLLHHVLQKLQEENRTPQLFELCRKYFCKETIAPGDLETVPFLISAISSFCEDEKICSLKVSQLLSKLLPGPSTSDASPKTPYVLPPKSDKFDPEQEDRLIDLLETIMLSSRGACLRTGKNICVSFWRNLSSHTPKTVSSTILSVGDACLRSGKNICASFWRNLSATVSQTVEQTALPPEQSTTTSHSREVLSSMPGSLFSTLSYLAPDMTAYLKRPSFWNKLLQKTHTISHRVGLLDKQIFSTLGNLIFQPALFSTNINRFFADVLDKKELPRIISTLSGIMSHKTINDSDRAALSKALAYSFYTEQDCPPLNCKLISSLLSLWKKITSKAFSASMSSSQQACLDDIMSKYLGRLLKHLYPTIFIESSTESITGLINKLNHTNSHCERFSELLARLTTCHSKKITQSQLVDMIPVAIEVAQNNPDLLHDRCLLNALHKIIVPQEIPTPISTPDSLSTPGAMPEPPDASTFKSSAQKPSAAISIWRAISSLSLFSVLKNSRQPAPSEVQPS